MFTQIFCSADIFVSKIVALESIEIIKKKDHLRFRFEGEYDFNAFLGVFLELNSLCVEYAEWRVVLDFTKMIGADISQVDRYFLVSEIVESVSEEMQVYIVFPFQYSDFLLEQSAQMQGKEIVVLPDLQSAYFNVNSV